MSHCSYYAPVWASADGLSCACAVSSPPIRCSAPDCGSQSPPRWGLCVSQPRSTSLPHIVCHPVATQTTCPSPNWPCSFTYTPWHSVAYCLDRGPYPPLPSDFPSLASPHLSGPTVHHLFWASLSDSQWGHLPLPCAPGVLHTWYFLPLGRSCIGIVSPCASLSPCLVFPCFLCETQRNPRTSWLSCISRASQGLDHDKWFTQSCQTLCDPMDCSPPGSFIHGILQARILEWVSIPFSRGSSSPRDRAQVSCIAGGFFTVWATREIGRHPVNASWMNDWWMGIWWMESWILNDIHTHKIIGLRWIHLPYSI